ncbi:MAG: hypothetical protein IJX19_06355 [Clostridia bacterium]|nr:hypothetical protein [Clostridia bacterium]
MLEFLFAPTALYVDPTSVSILLTSISGVIIAISATAVIFWRKAKKKVSNVLHIDENANKEVEEDIVINEPAEK